MDKLDDNSLRETIIERSLVTDPDVRFNQPFAALKERSFRLTPQLDSLGRLIAVSEDHASSSQLLTKIKRQFPTMRQATVYKTLILRSKQSLWKIASPR